MSVNVENKMNIVWSFRYSQKPSNDQGEDFEMTSHSAWLKVGDYSLQIVDDADELRVRVYPYGDELEEIDALYIAK